MNIVDKIFSSRWKIALVSLGVIAVILITLSLRPALLFAYSLNHENFVLHSDRPIEPEWIDVLADAKRRLNSSDLYDEHAQLRIFVCNEPWRLWFFTRNTYVGGFTDTFITRNIYLREAVAAENRIIPPSGTLADAKARTLSYFVAHEGAHVMQSREFGRLVSLQSPKWLVEGYADLVGKAGDFGFEENQRLLIDGDPLLSEATARRGIYRRYHLMTEQALKQTNGSVRRLFNAPPKAGAILTELGEDQQRRND
jgi:hypothetical protein